MKVESSLVVELWSLIVDQLPQARRAETAVSFLRAFEDYGMDQNDLADIVDEDTHLARAFITVFEDELNAVDDEEDGEYDE